MEIDQFLADPKWDAPFFKRLARNDTTEASGHQGGMVLPKDLRRFLPGLEESGVSSSHPTVDRRLKLAVCIDCVPKEEDTVRYQIQTWGDTRSPESRLTDGMRVLRERANAGDILLMQRRMDSLDVYRACLVTQSSEEMAQVESLTRGTNWGALYIGRMPVAQEDIEEEQATLERAGNRGFELFSPPVRTEKRQLKLARSAVFSERVRRMYEFRCAISGSRVLTPNGLSEVEAAHIIPLEESGTNDFRNGICLARTLHWAFDHGLFGLSEDRAVHIPERVRECNVGEFLMQFEGRQIAEPTESFFRAHEKALRWHCENKVGQWER